MRLTDLHYRRALVVVLMLGALTAGMSSAPGWSLTPIASRTQSMPWGCWALANASSIKPSSLTVGTNLDGRMEVFRDTYFPGKCCPEGALHVAQNAPNGDWGAWETLGSPPSLPWGLRVAANQDGRLEAFANMGDAVGHIAQTAPNSAWGAWEILPPPSDVGLGWPAVGTNADGRLEVFSQGHDDAGNLSGIWHIAQTAPNGGWGSWENLGRPEGIEGAIYVFLAVGRNADGRLEVFATQSNGGASHIAQTKPGGTWGTWSSLATPLGLTLYDTSMVSNADGRLEVFAIQEGGGPIWHIAQTSPNGTWGSFENLGRPSSAWFYGPAVGSRADGRLEVMVQEQGKGLWHVTQTIANGAFGTWEPLGEPVGSLLSLPAVGSRADGILVAFALDYAGRLWWNWEGSPSCLFRYLPFVSK